MSTQDTTLPPMLAALKEKIAEAIKVSDDVGRSRGRNCYAQNTRAVVKICELQESISRDLETLAAHDKEAAIRLRSICDDLGMVHAVPETDEQLMESKFAVFGMIRRALARAAIAAQALQPELDVRKIMLDVAPGWDGEGVEVYAKSVREVEDLLTKMGGRIEELEGQAQQAQGVPTEQSILLELGRQMVALTTTVRGSDEWLCIPELWRMCAQERDELRAKLAAAPQAEQQAPEPLSPEQSASLQWLERLCEPALYLDRLGPIRDYLRAHGIGTKGGI